MASSCDHTLCRKRYREGGADAGLALDGNRSAGVLDNLFNDVEADARPLDVGVQALKHAEEFSLLGFVEPQAVVVHLEYGGALGRLVGPQVHNGGAVGGAILHGIAEQVVNQTAEVFGRERHGGAHGHVDAQLGPSGFEQGRQIETHSGHHGSQVGHAAGLQVGLLQRADVGQLGQGELEPLHGALHHGQQAQHQGVGLLRGRQVLAQGVK